MARIHQNFPGSDYTHLWSTLGSLHRQSHGHPLDRHRVRAWAGSISFGYWTTDFLVVQRVLAAKDLRAAKMAPIIGAVFQDGGAVHRDPAGPAGARACCPCKLVPEKRRRWPPGGHSYNEVLPLMLARYCGPGLLGLGITALIAGFMSGMAGNVSAFATVWTYDIYRAFIRKDATDAHYVSMGRWCTILGVLVSIGTAYLVMQFKSIMDYVQALFSFFIAPLFGTVLLGMLWKRATPAGGFWGLLAGTAVLDRHVGLGEGRSRARCAIIALSPHAKDMAENMYRALWSWLICVIVTVVVSLLTKPQARERTDGPGLRLHRIPVGRPPAAVPAADLLGGAWWPWCSWF